MPEFHLADSIITSLNAQEPWPDNVKLFQPYEVEQILLPDNASCLAVQAFLKMCNLPFEVEMRWNAEFMSPSGRVPFIKCGAFVVSELEPIVQFAANKGVTLCSELSTEEKAEMRAYMSLITNVLVNAELYISWIDNDTYNAVTKVRNSSVYPWPLSWLQTRSKRNAVAKRLKALNWHDKTLDQVLADVEQCCNSLSQRLGDRDYFFGNSPTAVDALVFGHMRALLSANGPKAALMIKPITTSLLKHLVKMVRATEMSLTPQEEYLVSQAFQVTRRRLSPERTISERSTRVRRSKLCLRNSRDNINYNRDVYGFKPFASKQIKIMSSKEGGLTCTYDVSKTSMSLKISEQNFALEIIEDILDKVEEISFDTLNKSDEHDFEIVYANDGDTKYVSNNDFLDTIEENVTDSNDGDPRFITSPEFNYSNNNFVDAIDRGAFVTARNFEEKGFVNSNYRGAKLAPSAHNLKEKKCDDTNYKEAKFVSSAHSFIDKYCDDSNYKAAHAYKEKGFETNYKGAKFTPSARKFEGNDLADTKYREGESATAENFADKDFVEALDSADQQSTTTEMFNIIHDESDVEDSDGMVTDKHLASRSMTNCNDSGKNILDSDSSKNKENKGADSLTSNGSRISTEKSRTPMSSRSGSKSTLKVPSDEEISVESLLKHLRERNAAYGNTLEVADID